MKKAVLLFLLLLSVFLIPVSGVKADKKIERQVMKLLKNEVIAQADKLLVEKPVTITSFVCKRSAGGIHDFYSEGDYWWPDPANPEGPYIQRDGMTNPENFVDHRKAMIRLSQIVGSLASAYKITGDEKYVKQAFVHLRTWFVDTATRMNPSLLYSQAIKGRFTGRGVGIIDTIQLMEVAQGIIAMGQAKCIDKQLLNAIKSWFADYLQWLMTHQYGKDEMNAKNNHGTCWVMQAASFAKLTGNNEILDFCRKRYKEALLPDQMGPDGSFPQEIRRTKPYGYSLFNLDAMTMVCLILSDKDNDLWNFQTSDGKSIRNGIEFLYPYVSDKSKWPYKKDVMYWDDWPVAHPFLLFGANQFNVMPWFKTWSSLDHFPKVEEVVRNLPVRNPLIWFN
ncbi:MAG: alginate lyase family protein [Bacteroidia bacterium]|nr:alginate lyase family protein [Bacteroidia bacterium]